ELETAAGEAAWWSDARRFLGLGENAPLPEGFVGIARSTPADEPLEDLSDTLSLEFLAPTDDPAMLGRMGPYEIAGLVGRGWPGAAGRGSSSRRPSRPSTGSWR